MASTTGNAHYPAAAPIEAYGNGGFRFAGMSHRGSLLCLPGATCGWHVASIETLGLDDLAPILARADVRALLLGTGRRQVFPSLAIRRAFLEARIGLDPMDTGAACRTWNVLLAEKRPVAAALIAVE